MYVLMSTMNGVFVARTGEMDGCALDDHRRKQCMQYSALKKHRKGVAISRRGAENAPLRALYGRTSSHFICATKSPFVGRLLRNPALNVASRRKGIKHRRIS